VRRRDLLRAGVTLPAAAAPGLLASPGARASEPFTATVRVQPGRVLGKIDPKVYGHQLEHLERIVYGGVFDPRAPRADALGLRRDVIDAVAEMGGARVVRWPGGNFASYYHFRDGLGPRSRRPRRYDVVWETYEPNHFGTDEYLALCRALQAEPFITVNMGSGTLREACEWVEHCRRSPRRPPVEIWGLGNEHFGPWQVGHYTAEEYARKAVQYARFMTAVQRGLRFVAVGTLIDPRWNEVVLRACGGAVEWLTLHQYCARSFLDGADDFDATVATPALIEAKMRETVELMEDVERHVPRKEPLRLCLEEWNTRHFQRGKLLRESPRNIVDALFVAGVFNACQRLAARVTMTNYIYFVNAHAPISVRGGTLVRSATFDVFRLYATKMLPLAVAAEIEGPTFVATLPPATMADYRPGEPARVPAPRLDASATVSADGARTALALLNRDRQRSARVALELGAALPPTAELHTLAAPALDAVNSPEQPGRVRSQTRTVSLASRAVELPPASVNVLLLDRRA
jgi:alpha-L-arabinofuranosidase